MMIRQKECDKVANKIKLKELNNLDTLNEEAELLSLVCEEMLDENSELFKTVEWVLSKGFDDPEIKAMVDEVDREFGLI